MGEGFRDDSVIGDVNYEKFWSYLMVLNLIDFKRFLFFWLLVLGISTPNFLMEFKIVIILTLVLFSLPSLSMNYKAFQFLLFCFMLYIVFIVGLVYGIYVNEASLSHFFGLYIVAPPLWFLFFIFFDDLLLKRVFHFLVFRISVLFCIVFFALHIAEFQGISNSFLSFLGSFLGIRFGWSDESVKGSSAFLPFLFFATGFAFEHVLRNGNFAKFESFVFILLFFTSAISGRSAFVLIAAFIACRLLLSISFGRLIFLLILFSLLVSYLDISKIWDIFLYKLDPANGDIRLQEISEALHLISIYPLLGVGVGYVFSSVNSINIEITPLHILVSHGIPFVLFGFISFVVICLRLIKDKNFAVFVSPVVLFLLLSTTNPILMKFSFLWVLILPFSLYFRIINRSSG